jgi:hypothetical protein
MEVLGDKNAVAFSFKPFEGVKGVGDVLKGSAGFGFCDPLRQSQE